VSKSSLQIRKRGEKKVGRGRSQSGVDFKEASNASAPMWWVKEKHGLIKVEEVRGALKRREIEKIVRKEQRKGGSFRREV